MRRARRSPAAGLGRHAALTVTMAFALLPFIWMVSLSTKPPAEIFEATFRIWPETFYALENYSRALAAAPLLRFIVNGLIVTGAILALQILVATPAAYALAKLRFKGRGLLFALVLVALLLPKQVLALPHFIMLSAIGLLDSYAALILPSIVSPFAIFLFRQFFKTVPNDLIDAARLDGLSEVAILWRIMIPIAAPAIAAFGILSVVAHWNDLFWPLVVIRNEELATPPLGIIYFRNDDSGTEHGPMMAAAVLIAAPLVAAFLVAQRRFIEGIAMTGAR